MPTHMYLILNVDNSWKSYYFFVCLMLKLVTENEIDMIIIRYNFRPVFYISSKQPKITVFKIIAV